MKWSALLLLCMACPKPPADPDNGASDRPEKGPIPLETVDAEDAEAIRARLVVPGDEVGGGVIWQGVDFQWRYNHRANRLGFLVEQDVPCVGGQCTAAARYTAASGEFGDTARVEGRYAIIAAPGLVVRTATARFSFKGAERTRLEGRLAEPIAFDLAPGFEHAVVVLNGFDLANVAGKATEGEADALIELEVSLCAPTDPHSAWQQARSCPGMRDVSGLNRLEVDVHAALEASCETMECDKKDRAHYTLDVPIALLAWSGDALTVSEPLPAPASEGGASMHWSDRRDQPVPDRATFLACATPALREAQSGGGSVASYGDENNEYWRLPAPNCVLPDPTRSLVAFEGWRIRAKNDCTRALPEEERSCAAGETPHRSFAMHMLRLTVAAEPWRLTTSRDGLDAQAVVLYFLQGRRGYVPEDQAAFFARVGDVSAYADVIEIGVPGGAVVPQAAPRELRWKGRNAPATSAVHVEDLHFEVAR